MGTKPRPRRTKQLSWLPSSEDSLGALNRGTHAKFKRPIESKKPLHVCVRSQQAVGLRTMLGRNRLKVHEIILATSRKTGVRVVKFANVGNHLHLVVKLPGRGQTARNQYKKWIRAITGLIAAHIGRPNQASALTANDSKTTGAAKTRFWDQRPFTRVVHGRTGFRVIDRYVLKNRFEALGYSKDVAILMAKEHFDSLQVYKLPLWSATKAPDPPAG